MLMDLWEWFLLINDGIDLVLSNLSSGTYPVPFSFLLVLIFLGLISYLAWRTTDIPDLPQAPRPPYLIQITTPRGLGQRIADVRVIGGRFSPTDLRNRLHFHNFRGDAATRTDQNAQPGTATGARNGERSGTNQNIRRGFPGRFLLLELYRRQNYLDSLLRRRPPVEISGGLQAQQTSSPNVVVYHRVNVYHHHIHSNSNPTPPPSTVNQGASSNSESDSNNQSRINQRVQADSFPPQPGPSSTLPIPEQPSESQSTVNVNVGGSTGVASTLETSRIEHSAAAIRNEGLSPSTSHSDEQEPSPWSNNEIGSFSPSPSSDPTPTLDPQVLNFVNNRQGQIDAINSTQNLSYCPTPSTSDQQNMSAESSRNDSSVDTGNACRQRGSVPPPTGGGNDVRFTIKFLNDTQMDVTSQMCEKMGDFKRRHFAVEMSENKTVRLIFNGRVLDNDNKTLGEFGVFDQCVVHCLIVNRQENRDQVRHSSNINTGGPGRANDAPEDPLMNIRRLTEPGMFFIAFIGVFLTFLWFICLHFGQQLFTQSAIVSLTLLTVIFLIGIVACYLPLPTN